MLRLIALLVLVGCIDTEYAPRYSDQGWGSIRVGDSESTVLSKIGHPLEVRDFSGSAKGWIYSRSPSSAHYFYRELRIDDTGVVHVDSHFYFD